MKYYFRKQPESYTAFCGLIGSHLKGIRVSKGISLRKMEAALRAQGNTMYFQNIYKFEAGQLCISVPAIAMLYETLGIKFPEEVLVCLPVPGASPGGESESEE